MGSKVPIETFENLIAKGTKNKVDLVVSIELDLDLIINNNGNCYLWFCERCQTYE